MGKWTHNSLAHDLAEHLQNPARMVWEDMQLGPSGSPRPDVYTMEKSYTQPKPRAYEVKISVSDFRSDITAGKWQSYLQFASSVTFCVPQGLITKNDIPNGCGLMVRGEGGWKTLKAPTIQRVTLPEKALLKLLIDGINQRNRDHRAAAFNAYAQAQKLRKELGDEVADVIQDRILAKAQAERIVDRAKEEAASIRKRAEFAVKDSTEAADKIKRNAENAVKELAQVLGLDSMASEWQVRHAALQFANRHNADTRLNSARNSVACAKKELERSLKQLEDMSNG